MTSGIKQECCRRIVRLISGVSLFGFFAIAELGYGQSALQPHGGLTTFEPTQVDAATQHTECVPAPARQQAERHIASFHARYGYPSPHQQEEGSNSQKSSEGPRVGGAGLTPYTFHPQAGILGQDLFINNYVDLDGTSGLRDYACSDVTYDGHQGHDVEVTSFNKQALGVPIFAALDGTVADAHDGENDMNTVWANQPANYVILYHGGTHYTWYWHMKKNSVAVSTGQVVKAGSQLGLTGSSGNSTGPHLHFESRDSGTWFEPDAGTCRSGTTNWVTQPGHSSDAPMFPGEFTVTLDNLTTWTGPPVEPATHTGSITPGSKTVYFWTSMHNLPAASTWRVKILNPSSTVVSDTNGSLGNAFYRDSWWWWSRTLSYTVVGTWRIQLFFNSTMVADAPLEVTNTITNRAPATASVAFTPSSPSASDVIICKITNWTVIDDPDYDIVRYHYVWKVNGATQRDVVSAALSDVFPRNTAPAGASVQCTVTPGDGIISATSASANTTISGLTSVGSWQDYE